jgi:hypothetical protein
MVTMQYFEVMSGKCNTMRICTSENYAQNGSLECIIINCSYCQALEIFPRTSGLQLTVHLDVNSNRGKRKENLKHFS